MSAPIQRAAQAIIDDVAVGEALPPDAERFAHVALAAALDRDELARVLWPYAHAWDSALPEHRDFYLAKADAVIAHLTKEASGE